MSPSPHDRLTSARLAARLERAGVELVVREGELSATAADASTLARVITPALREEIARLKPVLIDVLGSPLSSSPVLAGLTRALSAIVRCDPAWSTIPTIQARWYPRSATCVICSKLAEHRFANDPVHPACFFATAPHALDWTAGVSCCTCPLCDGSPAHVEAPPVSGFPFPAIAYGDTSRETPAPPDSPSEAPAPADPLDAIFAGENSQDIARNNSLSLAGGLS